VSSVSPVECWHAVHHVLVGVMCVFQAKGNHVMRVKTQYLLNYTELKHVHPHFQQIGIAVTVALPAIMNMVQV
jgi:hypothetical protein